MFGRHGVGDNGVTILGSRPGKGLDLIFNIADGSESHKDTQI